MVGEMDRTVVGSFGHQLASRLRLRLPLKSCDLRRLRSDNLGGFAVGVELGDVSVSQDSAGDPLRVTPNEIWSRSRKRGSATPGPRYA
jgi:hypothetical protein